MKTSRLLLSVSVLSVAVLGTDCFAVSDCVYSGVNFSDGALSCQTGQQFRCSDGTWQSLDIPCTASPSAPTVVNPALCECTPPEVLACTQSGKACCVSMESGSCVKKCCQGQ